MKYNCWLYLKVAKFLSNDPYGMLNITSGTKLPVFRFKHTEKSLMKIILLKIIPSAVVVRQTSTKVLTTYRGIKKMRRSLKCFHTDLKKRKKERNTMTRDLNMNNIKPTQVAMLLTRCQPSHKTCHWHEKPNFLCVRGT